MTLLKAGSVLGGRFELLERLGQGGFGTVWRAHHKDLDEDYALKVLNPELAKDPELQKRFLREVKLATSFVHEYAVQVREFGRDADSGALYFTMDLVPGRSLQDALKQDGALAPPQAVRPATQALKVLEKAHETGLIHRDLKPANVMLTPGKSGEEQVRVLDFGIAKAVGPAATETTDNLTMTGQTIGTLPYMSPEQAQGRKLDARSDLYSMGVMLYEMLSRKRPIEADADAENSRQSLLFKLVAEPARDLGEVAPHVSEPLKAVVMKALEKEPSARFGDATAFLAALGATAGQLQSGVPATNPSFPAAIPDTARGAAADPESEVDVHAPTLKMPSEKEFRGLKTASPGQLPRTVETPAPLDATVETPAPLDATVETPAPLNPTVETPAPLNPTVETPAPLEATVATPPPTAEGAPSAPTNPTVPQRREEIKTPPTRPSPVSGPPTAPTIPQPVASTADGGGGAAGLVVAAVALLAIVGGVAAFSGDKADPGGTTNGLGGQVAGGDGGTDPTGGGSTGGSAGGTDTISGGTDAANGSTGGSTDATGGNTGGTDPTRVGDPTNPTRVGDPTHPTRVGDPTGGGDATTTNDPGPSPTPTAVHSLKVTSPADGAVVDAETLTVEGSLTPAAPAEGTVAGAPLAFDGERFQGNVTLAQGANRLELSVTPRGHRKPLTQVLTVTLDLDAPTLAVTSPAGSEPAQTAADHVVVKGTVADDGPVEVLVDGQPATVADGRFSGRASLPKPGAYAIDVVARDGIGREAKATVEVVRKAAQAVGDAEAPPAEVLFPFKLQAKSIGGKPVTLFNLRQRVGFVLYWSHHSPQSQRVAKALAELRRERPNDVAAVGLVFDAVSSDAELSFALQRLKTSQKIDFPQARVKTRDGAASARSRSRTSTPQP
jgi:serine/threonine-protein kinase